MRQDILLEQKIGLRLSRVGVLSRLFALQIFSKSGFDLRPEQFTVLSALYEHDGLYLRQLGSMTYKDRPNMTRIVSILEENGYVTSVLEASGRQVKKLFITEKGKKVCQKMLSVILEVWDKTVDGIDEQEIESFLTTLNKMEENIKKRTIIQV